MHTYALCEQLKLNHCDHSCGCTMYVYACERGDGREEECVIKERNINTFSRHVRRVEN